MCLEDGAYDEALHKLKTRPMIVPRTRTFAEKQATVMDYYKNVRTNVLLAWTLSNVSLFFPFSLVPVKKMKLMCLWFRFFFVRHCWWLQFYQEIILLLLDLEVEMVELNYVSLLFPPALLKGKNPKMFLFFFQFRFGHHSRFCSSNGFDSIGGIY